MEYDAITRLNQELSPLLRLPAELRNKIYEYAIGGHEVDVTPCKEHPRFRHRRPNDKSLVRLQGSYLYSLEATCRQLRQETLNMWLALNTFTSRPFVLKLFFASIGKKKHHIEVVRILSYGRLLYPCFWLGYILDPSLSDAVRHLFLFGRIRRVSIVAYCKDTLEAPEDVVLDKIVAVLFRQRFQHEVELVLELE